MNFLSSVQLFLILGSISNVHNLLNLLYQPRSQVNRWIQTLYAIIISFIIFGILVGVVVLRGIVPAGIFEIPLLSIMTKTLFYFSFTPSICSLFFSEKTRPGIVNPIYFLNFLFPFMFPLTVGFGSIQFVLTHNEVDVLECLVTSSGQLLVHITFIWIFSLVRRSINFQKFSELLRVIGMISAISL